MKIVLVFILTLIATLTFADMTTPPKGVERQYFRSQNMLTNPGFELGVSGWTRSGSSTFSTGTAASDAWIGRYGLWNASAASETLTSNTWTITSSGAGVLLGECKVKTVDSDYKLQIYNSTDAVVIAETTIVASDGTSYPSAYTSVSAPILPNGASKNIVLRLISASNAGNVYIDDCYLGYYKDYAQATQIQNWTQYTPTFTNFGTVTVQTFYYAIRGDMLFIVGRFTGGTPAGSEARISLPGSYTALSGLTTLQNVGVYARGTSVTTSSYQVLVEPGVAYMTFGGQGSTGGPLGGKLIGTAVSDPASVNGLFAAIPINNVPTIEAYTGQQLDWRVDANITASVDISLGTVAVTTYTGIESSTATLTNNTSTQGSIANVFIPCSGTNDSTGTTCSAGNESVGIAFTPPRAGWVQVCAAFAHNAQVGASGSLASVFQIVKTPNAAQTISVEGQERIESTNNAPSTTIVNPNRNCGIFYLDSVTKHTFRLMYEQFVSGTVTQSTLRADASSVAGQRDIHWSVIPLSSYVAPPVSLGNVVTVPQDNGIITTGFKLLSASVSSAGVVSREDGNFINGNCAVTDTSLYTCTFNTSYFANTPNCIATLTGTTANQIRINTESSSSIAIRTLNSSGSNSASSFNVFCMDNL